MTLGLVTLFACGADSSSGSPPEPPMPEGGAPTPVVDAQASMDAPNEEQVDGGRDAGSVTDADASAAPSDPLGSPVPLHGLVLDAETRAPVVGAVITSELGAQTTGVDGAFVVMASAARTTVDVTSAGYLSARRTLPSTNGEGPPLALFLAKSAAPRPVATSGGELSAQRATLSFAAGTFATSTEVSATWLDVAAAPAEVQFVTLDGVQHRLVGSLEVSATSQPSRPVSVRIDIGAGETWSMFELDGSGRWGARHDPISVVGNVATFELPHFSGYGFTTDRSVLDTNNLGYVVIDATPTLGYVPGDVLRESNAVDTGADGRISFVDPLGETVRVGAATHIRIGPVSKGGVDPDLKMPLEVGAGSITVQDGAPVFLHSFVSKKSTYPRFMVRRTRTSDGYLYCAGGVRGTVAGLGATLCEDLERTFCRIDVSEGELVLVLRDGTTTVLSRGTTTLPGIGSANATACCDTSNCPTGCTVDGTCPYGIGKTWCGPAGVGGSSLCDPSYDCIECPPGGNAFYCSAHSAGCSCTLGGITCPP